MRSLFFILVLGLCACCHPQPQPVQPQQPPMPPSPRYDLSGESEYGYAYCPSATTLTLADACDGMFTKQGLSCAHCGGGANACFFATAGIYCAKGRPGCLDDDNCVHVRGDGR